MEDINIKIDLQPKQLEALNCLEHSDCKILGYGGAKGGGKSYLVRAKEIYRRLKYPRTTGLIVRESFPQLKANYLRKIFMEFPIITDWYKASDMSIYYPNGSATDFRHIDATEDVYKYSGIEYDDVTIDQAEQHLEEVFKILKTCIRQDPIVRKLNPKYKPKMLLTFNPGGIGNDWIRRIFINKEFKWNEKSEHYEFIQAKVWDNPILMKYNPDYVDNLMDLPEEIRKAFLDGDFNVFYGQFFKKLDPEIHLVDEFRIPDNWLKFRSLDWGYGHPSVCLWWAVSPEQKVFIYRGYKTKEKVPSVLASEILELTPITENIIETFAGTDLWAKIKTDEALTDVTMADLMMNAGLYLEKANTDRKAGWATLREYLEWNKDKKPVPNLRIFKSYRWIFEDLRKLIHDDIDIEDVKKVRGDDTGDAGRYGIMHLYGNKVIEAPKPASRIQQIIEKLENKSVDLGLIGGDNY